MAVEAELGVCISQPSRLFFSNNPLHDLESLWWVGVWYLLCHYQTSKLRDIAVQQHIEVVVKRFGETLFTYQDPHSRRNALIHPALLPNIKPLSFRKAVQHFILLLELFRNELVKHYEIYKPLASQDRSFFNPDHLNLHRKFG